MLQTLKYFLSRVYTITSIVLFALSYGAIQAYAVYYPTDNITNPTCAPGDSGCYVSLLPDQTSKSGSLLFTNGTNPSWTGSSSLSWDSVNGRLGVGTATPVSNLDITTTSGNSIITMKGNAGVLMSMYRYSNNVTRPRYEMYKARGDQVAPLVVQAGDELGSMDFYGYDGSAFQRNAIILVNAASVSGAIVTPKLSFGLGASANSNDYYFSLNQTGAVFSGGNSTSITPLGRLHLKGSTSDNTANALYVENSAATNLFTIKNSGDIESPGNIYSAGLKWNFVNSPDDTKGWAAITYGNGIFVAIAISGGTTDRFATSPDGINWTMRIAPSTSSWRSVTYGNGLFVASAHGGNRIATSPDGINWTTRIPSTGQLYSVTYGKGLFVATKFDNNGTKAVTSPDGINWTNRATPAGGDNLSWFSVTYGNGLFVAVLNSAGGEGVNRIATSPDGITWTIQTTPSINPWSVVYGDGMYIATGSSGKILKSTDGINWSLSSTLSGNIMHVVYGDGLFVATAGFGGANANYIYTSSDGVNWTSRNTSSNDWYGIAYGNGRFVTISLSGTAGSRFAYSGKLNTRTGDFFTDNVKQGISNITGGLILGSDEGSNLLTNGATLRAPNMIGGTTTDIGGASLSFAGGLGTGAGVGGSLIFSTPQVTTSGTTIQTLTERMRINSSGYVGIGTTTPVSNLQIKSGTNNEIQIGSTVSENGNSSTFSDLVTLGSSINFSRPSDGRFINTIINYQTSGNLNNLGIGARHDLVFSAGEVERMRIKYTGNVGIGNSNPLYKFVVGDGNGSSDYNTPNIFSPSVQSTSNSGQSGVGVSVNDGVNNPRIAMFADNTAQVVGFSGTYSTGITGMVFRFAGSERMRINSSGFVGISNASPSYTLQVGSGSVVGIVSRFQNSTGTCDINPTTTSLSCSSDRTLKTNITNLNNTILNQITSLQPVTYTWINDNTNQQQTGFIAQDVEAIFPSLVSTDPTTNLKSLNYIGLIPYAIEGIRELDIKVNQLSSLDTTLQGSFAFLLKEVLGNVSNGINELYVKVVKSDRVETDNIKAKTICLGTTCINEEQLIQIINQNNIQQPVPQNQNTEIIPETIPSTEPVVEEVVE